MDIDKTLMFTDLGGEVKRVRRLIDYNNQSWSAFNPSIAYSPGEGLAMLVRSSNYLHTTDGSVVVTEGNLIHNRMYFCKIFDDLAFGDFTLINFFGFNFPLSRGVEDGKLYWRDDGWEFTGVVREPDGVPYPRMATFRLSDGEATLLKLYDDPWMGNTPEKNWMSPYEKNPSFDYIYSSSSIYKDGSVVKVRDVPDEYKNLRGTSNLWELSDGNYLALVHTTRLTKNTYYDPARFGIVSSNLRDYDHMFAVYDNSGKLIKISKNFKFLKPGIEYASGLVVKNKTVIISFGRSDMSSYFATIDLEAVLNILKDV